MAIFHDINDPKVAALLKEGAVGVLPTDTVYGLVCLAVDESAVKRLYDTKGRHKKPGTVIAANIEQITDLGIPRRYLTAVEQYWPNPISIVIPSVPDLSYIDLGRMSLAMRIPSDKQVNRLLKKTGPLLTTSANLPGEPPANTIAEAQSYFGDKADFFVDGGDLSDRLGSTIIQVIDDAVEVVREGAVKINEKGEIVT